ncbi:hypothetical protein BDV96DRAFT_597226 [Lophiotrema nucula]|uniref:Uncharacterized protein n=1 Tax=Lophiotrema nucula TaxID=690887 RepID=A0A6A5ZGP4_9PLEO|nr:hypothetical protein BDV96DRAFT_597226 [Lophiotrema nucula]
MVSESTYIQMKARTPEVKQLFRSRHYVQCATLCERYLTQSYEVHPIHKAYLNFYLALSHDTLAREAGMRNRHKELDLAEKHYLEAIAALSPPKQLGDIEEYPSPTSSHSDEDFQQRHSSDTASIHSQHSTTTNATSVGDENQDEASDCEPTPKRSSYFVRSPPSRNFVDDVTMTPKLSKRRPSPIKTSRSTTTPVQDHFYSGLSSFAEMIQSHLAGVRELKEASTYRYSFSRSRGSSLNSRPASREYTHDTDDDMNKVRWSRQSLSFRPRFDPRSIRQLCNEALAEL